VCTRVCVYESACVCVHPCVCVCVVSDDRPGVVDAFVPFFVDFWLIGLVVEIRKRERRIKKRIKEYYP
jgi:hypothetical protein